MTEIDAVSNFNTILGELQRSSTDSFGFNFDLTYQLVCVQDRWLVNNLLQKLARRSMLGGLSG
jgi:hypothetical protein